MIRWHERETQLIFSVRLTYFVRLKLFPDPSPLVASSASRLLLVIAWHATSHGSRNFKGFHIISDLAATNVRPSPFIILHTTTKRRFGNFFILNCTEEYRVHSLKVYLWLEFSSHHSIFVETSTPVGKPRTSWRHKRQ